MIAPTVVFDLDGTLVDTTPDLVSTLNVVLAREGIAPVAYEEARNMVGGGARVMLERGLAAQHRTLPTATLDRLVGDFIDHYGEHIADNSRPFAGVEAALDDLAAGGCRLAVCTNKLEWLSLRLLDALGLRRRFAAICGADTFAVCKPDPAVLRQTIGCAGGRAELAVMVGARQPTSRRPARLRLRSLPSTLATPTSRWRNCVRIALWRASATCRRWFSPCWPPRKANSPGSVNSKFTLWSPHLGDHSRARLEARTTILWLRRASHARMVEVGD